MSNSTLVRFENNGIEFVIDGETMELWLTVSGYSKMSGIDFSVVDKEPCVLPFEGHRVLDDDDILKLSVKYAVEFNSYKSAFIIQQSIRLGLNPDRAECPLDGKEAMTMCEYLYSHIYGNKKISKKWQQPSNKHESVIQRSLQKQLGGKIEVVTPCGRIDLLTENKIIEIKEAKSWKNGIGQLLAYAQSYPDHEKVLYLFGDTDALNLSDVKYVLASLDISLEIVQMDC